ncbi:hypothetical protein FRC15_006797 [Serendipita sp. 397]|nr:hypothetical protein FRC15_006797 [Serendipita sp. 397]
MEKVVRKVQSSQGRNAFGEYGLGPVPGLPEIANLMVAYPEAHEKQAKAWGREKRAMRDE